MNKFKEWYKQLTGQIGFWAGVLIIVPVYLAYAITSFILFNGIHNPVGLPPIVPTSFDYIFLFGGFIVCGIFTYWLNKE